MISYFKILLLLLTFFIIPKNVAQDYVLNYQHLQIKDGLANAFVNCALQDNEGFMWFGTKDGLCRYDGKNFLTFRNNEEDSIFLASNSVQAIVQLDERFLLIGTTAGLSKLDLYTQKVSTIDFFNQKNILSIFIDSQKTIWIVANKQLFCKEDKLKEWKNYSSSCRKQNPDFDTKNITSISERTFNQENYLIISEEINNPPIIITQLSLSLIHI